MWQDTEVLDTWLCSILLIWGRKSLCSTAQKRNAPMQQEWGAVRYVNVTNPEELKGLNNYFDFILSTIPANYEPIMYLAMLKMGGELAIVGLPDKSTLNIANMAFLSQRKVYGSLIGGIKETQEMLDYSVKHGIYPEVVIINADEKEIDKAWKNVSDGNVKFRYVIDMSTIK